MGETSSDTAPPTLRQLLLETEFRTTIGYSETVIGPMAYRRGKSKFEVDYTFINRFVLHYQNRLWAIAARRKSDGQLRTAEARAIVSAILDTPLPGEVSGLRFLITTGRFNTFEESEQQKILAWFDEITLIRPLKVADPHFNIDPAIEQERQTLMVEMLRPVCPASVDLTQFINTFTPERAKIAADFMTAGKELTEKTKRVLFSAARSENSSPLIAALEGYQHPAHTAKFKSAEIYLKRILPDIVNEIQKDKGFALRFVQSAAKLTQPEFEMLQAFSGKTRNILHNAHKLHALHR